MKTLPAFMCDVTEALEWMGEDSSLTPEEADMIEAGHDSELDVIAVASAIWDQRNANREVRL